MELEFDKEMDALMRGKGVLVGDSPASGPHPDADEIAAFAENALPQRARALHMAHIADCGRCRKILSNIIALNAEAEPEMAAAAVAILTPAVEAAPWYRKLFLFPNLAYVMGGFVLVMGGLIGISVYQSSLSSGETAVSQVTESESARGPMAPTEPQFSTSASAANTMANAATSASNSNLAAATAPSGSANTASNAATKMNREGTPVDAAPTTSDVTTASELPAAKPAQPMSAAPPPPVAEVAQQKDADLAKEDDLRAKRLEENERNASALKKKQAVSLDGVDAKNIPRTQAGGVAKATPGPTRDMQQNFPNRAENTFELNSRRVGGRDFQFRNNAWYDTAYRGQATTNVRRGSDEYRKLDGGLRTIAENLSGVVVAVWGGKAYRIQ